MKLTEPDSAELIALSEGLSVAFLSYDPKLVRLDAIELLARYNRITLDFHNHSDTTPDRVFITVHRDGSKIGADNFYTIPLHLPELLPHTVCRYAVLSFDSFNEPFQSIRVNLTTPEEYPKRRLARNYLERAHYLATFLENDSRSNVT